MTENHDASAMPPRTIENFSEAFLAENAVAIIIKQQLLPDDVENPVIFPPTYLKAKGRSQGEEKDEKKESRAEQQKSVYNLDDLGDGANVCEIDSPQSDGNRSEPLFKTQTLRHLVPQIEIQVGNTSCNLLDAGHRAGDALVRFSSLAAEFHNAFMRADIGDHSALAVLAPTSLLYGAWDSRSTQTKLQRIIKAGIRAQNVRPLTKSATFVPAIDYVGVGAIKEELDVGEGDKNPLSSEGMKHSLASQTLGGVRLTDPKLLVRTIKINLVALRQLKAVVDPSQPQQVVDSEVTVALRNYILGLALTVATSDPDLNLREGCNLRIAGEDTMLLVRHREDDDQFKIDRRAVLEFADKSAKEFFKLKGIQFEKKDHPDTKFEKGVAEEFLSIEKSADRDKIRAMGPITKESLAKFNAEKKKRDKSGDPVEAIKKLVDALTVGKKDTFNRSPREKLTSHLDTMLSDEATDETLKTLATNIKALLTEDAGAENRKTQILSFFPAAPSDSEAASESESSVAQDGGDSK